MPNTTKNRYTHFLYADYHGKRIGSLVVISDAGTDKYNRPQLKVKCDCGNVFIKSVNNLNNKISRGTCGKCSFKYPHLRSVTYSTCGIYKIINPKGEIYIGQSRDMRHRWRSYCSYGNNGSKIRASINEYGVVRHVFKLIHKLPSDVSDEILDAYEQLYIDSYISCGIVVLNLKEGGIKGKHSKESILRMKGKNGVWMLGRKIPKEVVAKIIATKKKNKKPLSDESRDKYIKQQLGSNNTRAILSESDVLMILEMGANKEKFTIIAQKFNISTSTVSSVLNGWAWSHLTKIPKKCKKRYGRKEMSN